ncbi:hypothetical protein C4D60_Mb01t17560 [Musa balbisiana]|uniref:Uncharacterized protein n=1 Tax=Musa balbisiana TaxID=52838 RepID=A0A4S8JMW5_MUSBA|nr:hypothetical protein C4D60_Mb01t17560 [Musa balbisiana]
MLTVDEPGPPSQASNTNIRSTWFLFLCHYRSAAVSGQQRSCGFAVDRCPTFPILKRQEQTLRLILSPRLFDIISISESDSTDLCESNVSSVKLTARESPAHTTKRPEEDSMSIFHERQQSNLSSNDVVEPIIAWSPPAHRTSLTRNHLPQ